jgi:hypothetical protein
LGTKRASLIAYNRDLLDLAYFNKWITELKLSREFSDAWSQAFHEEPPPHAGSLPNPP